MSAETPGGPADKALELVEQVQTEERARLNATLEQAQLAHLQQRVVELGVRVHELEAQLTTTKER